MTAIVLTRFKPRIIIGRIIIDRGKDGTHASPVAKELNKE